MASPKVTMTNHNDLTGLYDAAPRARRTSGQTSASRAAREKKPLSRTDGRILRKMNRDYQYNTRVTQEIWEGVEEMCGRFDLTKAEFTDRAFAYFIEALRTGKATADD